MNDHDLHRVQGELAAMAMVLTQVTLHLPPNMRTAMAASLTAAADVQREADTLESTPAAAAAARDELLHAWIASLSAPLR